MITPMHSAARLYEAIRDTRSMVLIEPQCSGKVIEILETRQLITGMRSTDQVKRPQLEVLFLSNFGFLSRTHSIVTVRDFKLHFISASFVKANKESLVTYY